MAGFSFVEAGYAGAGAKEAHPVAGPTDDTIAARYVAQIDQRPWNALYERPNTPALLPDVKDKVRAACPAFLLVRGRKRCVRITVGSRTLGQKARVVCEPTS